MRRPRRRTTSDVFPPRRRQPERAEQASIVRLLRSLGAVVYVLGTTRPRGDYHGTCQTPGLPDLFAFLPSRATPGEWLDLWVEVKAPHGRLRPAQAAFRDYCQQAHVPHVVGGVDAVVRWLLDHGYVRESQVAHYRIGREDVA